MNKVTLLLGFLAVITLTAGFSSSAAISQSPTVTLPPSPVPTATLTADAQLAGKMGAALTALAEKGSLSGSILVARDGQVILSQGYGMANIELKTPNTPETKFHIGSLTKQFTAMAILQLQQQGKLDVQESACKYIEDCPEAWQPITIHQLLIHTSGIHEFNDTAGLKELILHKVTPLQIIAQFRDLPLDFTPGEKYAFSNSGYILLGNIIEKVSGQSYAAFLQQNIFDPLQMKNSGYYSDQQTGQDHAIGYKNATTPFQYVDKSINYSSSGLYSTVGDLLLWDQALYTDKLLPASLQDEMF
jgi:CubicO group peptidase (beta-lactamase class C family)